MDRYPLYDTIFRRQMQGANRNKLYPFIERAPDSCQKETQACWNVADKNAIIELQNNQRRIDMNFGERLAKARKEKNITQEQLAEMLGVSRQSVSKWESERG